MVDVEVCRKLDKEALDSKGLTHEISLKQQSELSGFDALGAKIIAQDKVLLAIHEFSTS